MRGHGEPHPWVQLNVALSRPDGQALTSARRVFAALAPLVDAWRRDGKLSQLYFMRKPPDLRLRLRGPQPAVDLLPGAIGALEQLRRDGAVERFFESVYEPEAHLFGGPDAMELVHAYFDADTRGWLTLDRLWASGPSLLTPEILACAVIDDLLQLALGDRSEIWDVWCNLAAGGVPAIDVPVPPSPELLGRLALAERTVLEHYFAHNSQLARGLATLHDSGRLSCGLRALLTQVALFHFHRYGLDAAEQAAMAGAMQRKWNPHSARRTPDPP